MLFFTVALYFPSTLTLTDKPESVTITPVNATAVNVSWSGSTHLSTRLQYFVYCTSSGSVMSEHLAGFSPGVSSAALEMEDDITLDFKYQHKFHLNYFDGSGAPGPVTTTTFSFGKYTSIIYVPMLTCVAMYIQGDCFLLYFWLAFIRNIHAQNVYYYLQIKCIFRFSLDPLTTASVGE